MDLSYKVNGARVTEITFKERHFLFNTACSVVDESQSQLLPYIRYCPSVLDIVLHQLSMHWYALSQHPVVM